MQPVRRRPVIQLGLLVLTILLGLGSRRYASVLPTIVATYAGDTLWALALFWFLGLILARMSTARVAAMALGLSLLVELSQLYHAPWIDSVRQTTIGGLILGFGFLWSDLACYASGVGLGVALETIGRGIRRD
jgi:Protein of unknown function (DUF2809)